MSEGSNGISRLSSFRTVEIGGNIGSSSRTLSGDHSFHDENVGRLSGGIVHSRDVGETCEGLSGESLGYFFGGIYGGNIDSREGGIGLSGDGSEKYVCRLVFYLCICRNLVGKIDLSVHDEIDSGGEEIDGFSGVTPDETRDIGEVGTGTTAELDVSRVGTVDSGLIGLGSCEGGGDKIRHREE